MRLGEARDQVAAELGETSRTLLNWQNLVRGRPRMEWLPRLAPKHARQGRKAAIDDELWRLFLGFIAESGPTLTVRHAWRTVRSLAEAAGGAWPSYDAVLARWNALPTQERALLRHGTKARDALIPHQTRSVAHLHAMAIVNLNGRYADVFVKWEDGTISRPIVLTAQDVFSRKVLARVYAKTENSDAIKELVLLVCDRFGVPGRILCDNGRGFMAKKMVAGTGRRFRWNVDNGTLGLLAKAGIELKVTRPYNGRGKPVERHFREDAREIDTRPEFKGAHCGGRPDAKPEDFAGKAVSIETFREVYEVCTAEQNARRGRRTEMGGGVKSFDQAFEESTSQRPKRVLTMHQRLYLRWEELKVSPDREGTIRLPNHRFVPLRAADHDALLKHRGKQVLVLYDPKNLAAGVRVEDLQRRVIVAELPLAGGRGFDEAEAAGEQARNTQRLKRGVEAQPHASRAQVLAALGIKGSAKPALASAAAELIRGNFKPEARPAKPEPRFSEAEIKQFNEHVWRGQELFQTVQEAAEWASRSERGGAATPPAQSATRAEARTTRTKSA